MESLDNLSKRSKVYTGVCITGRLAMSEPPKRKSTPTKKGRPSKPKGRKPKPTKPTSKFTEKTPKYSSPTNPGPTSKAYIF